MSFFPVLFIGMLAVSHLYVFWSLQRAFGGGYWQYGAFVLLVSGLLPVFLHRQLARLPAGFFLINLSFLWMGLIIILIIVLLCRDFLHLACLAADKLAGWRCGRFFTGVDSRRLAFAFGCLLFVYALFEAYDICVSRLVIATDKLPPAVEQVRIVAVADVHLTQRGDEARLRRIVDAINSQNPDIVVMLGDLVDDRLVDENALSEQLGAIAAPLGRYAVLGNHELYNDMFQSIDFIRKSGFTPLRGDGVMAGPIALFGIDDPALGGRRVPFGEMRAISPDRFVVLLSHRPEAFPEAAGLFDLQLSGHTHGGQILPGRLFSWLLFRRSQGLNHLNPPGEKTDTGRLGLLYLTNGAGYWGPPVRLFSHPEIVVVDVKRDKANNK